MKKTFAVAATLAVVFTLPACATLTRGTTQQFVVETTPSGAAVKTSAGFTCPATPCTFSLPRKESFKVTVSKVGYVTQTVDVTSGVAGGGAAGMAGNILLGGFIGIGVDATSGALNDLTPNPLQITLQAEGAVPVVPPPPSEAPAVGSVAGAAS